MILIQNITIPQLTGDEERRSYVYLPESYDYDENMYYPVLYMFDGHNVFFDEDATYGKSWGMEEYMDFTGRQCIVVGIECDHSPDGGRLSEYSPFDFHMVGYPGVKKGKADITLNWLINEFKPEIDASFRTIPDRDHTFIAGSSMGGLISLYAVLKYNDVFGRAACLSPSLWIAPNKSMAFIKEAPQVINDTIIYMDYGAEEFGGKIDFMKKFGRMTTLLLEKGAYVNSRIIPGGTHCEASWERQVPFFMDTLLYGLEEDFEFVMDDYVEVPEEFQDGYDVKAAEDVSLHKSKEKLKRKNYHKNENMKISKNTHAKNTKKK